MASAADVGPKVENAAYQLRKLLTMEGAELAQEQPWLWEFERWKEFVFALLARTTTIPEADLRLLVEQMTDLDLLDGEKMAATDEATTERVTALLEEAGLGPEAAAKVLTTLVEAARGLQKHFDGKIQKYLRRYGELMLHDVHEIFAFTAVTPDEVEDAFTYWLQNAVGLPLSLVDESVRTFCDHYGFSPADLIAGADRIDMNLATVDDLVQLHVLANEAAWSSRDA